MASQEEINLQKEQNELLRQQNELLRQRQGTSEKTLDDLRSFANLIQDQTKQITFQVAERKQLRSISNQILKLSQQSFSTLENELGTRKNIDTLIKQQSSLQKSLLGLESLKNKFNGENAELNANINSNIEKQIVAAQKLSKELNDQQILAEKIANTFGVKTFGALSDISKKIPGLNRFSEPFQNAAEAARSASFTNLGIDKFKELRKQGVGIKNALSQAGVSAKQVKLGSTKPFLAGIRSIGPALSKALGPVVIIAELVKGLMEADKQTNELGRSMMMTKDEARGFSSNISAAARSNYQMGITGTKVLANVTELNKQFGFITEFSGETLVSMTKLTYTLKIGAEEAGNLAAAAEATGVNFEDNYKNILAASYELQQQAGTQVDLRQVLTETGKVTGQIRANMGGNTVEIAKSVTNARLLGTEMQTIAAAGKQLLDFESSITKELEAELLIGRDINLERARAAALTGDQVTLQNELAKQMGSFEDFTKMNVIQQEALAGAMGMTADQVADMLFNQETMNKTAKELRDLGKDELANRLEQKTAQDKMNAAMAELKEVFVQLGTALSPILSLVSLLASAISTVVGFSMDLLNILNPFNNALSTDYKSQGIAAGKNLIGIEDGVIGPSGNLITTSPEDYLIATKNPQQMVSNVAAQTTPMVDTSKLERLLEESLNRTPPTPIVQMDSIEVGTVAGMSAFSIQ